MNTDRLAVNGLGRYVEFGESATEAATAAGVGELSSGVTALDIQSGGGGGGGGGYVASGAGMTGGFDPNAALFVEHVGGTTYFYRPEQTATSAVEQPVALPPAELLYAGTQAHVLDGRAASCGSRPAAAAASCGFGCDDQLRDSLQLQQRALLTAPNRAALPELPDQLGSFSQLVPLDDSDAVSRAAAAAASAAASASSSSVSCRCTCYKGQCTKTGRYFCLRRLHACSLSPAQCARVAARWRQLNHSNVIAVRDVFSTGCFGDESVVIVDDYYPIVETLVDKHFRPADDGSGGGGGGGGGGFADPFQDPSVPRPYSARRTAVQRQCSALLAEPLVWSYVVQLTAAVRAVHAAGLAFGGGGGGGGESSCLTPHCVLVAEERPRLAGAAVADLLLLASGTADSVDHHHHQQQQQRDLTALGRLLLALACNSSSALQPENTTTALAIVERHYSADLRALLLSLIGSGTGAAGGADGRPRSINDVMPMIGTRFYVQLEREQQLVLQLERQLNAELAAARAFRLAAQLAAVTERPQLGLDSGWAETGDRYMLKLFRDHVFHAVDTDGSAWPDLAHVQHSLNRLDVGSDRQVALSSRDGHNILVTSYCELRRCLDAAFGEIAEAAAVPKHVNQQVNG